MHSLFFMRKAIALLAILCPLAVFASQETTKEAIVKPESFPKKDSAEAAIIRGETAYKRYCILCHGVEADGKGRAAKNYDPKPANLRTSDKNTLYKTMIITRGGEAMGRSQFMPKWSEELTKEQVTDLVTYLDSIAVNLPKD